ncbi:hypothetical protein [Nonomuraea typhae]|uniref:hypothetical protein n=1 Tax=Nonomuraea typhae TaxID=2603600 RepID=UPI0012F9CD03|nr:hypothetical protein [Nonomuraea typhae]
MGTGRDLEIACDESGSEGENLTTPVTDVFAHAGVLLDAEAAQAVIVELRERIRSPATEYKANHLLRGKHRSALVWLLGPSGPIHGVARVYLLEKRFFLVSRIADLVDPYGPSLGFHRREETEALYRWGPRLDGWPRLLETFNDVIRGRAETEAFYAQVSALRSPELAELLERLGATRPNLETALARRADDPRAIPVLDPLIPAIVQGVLAWSSGGRSVSIIHDQQTTLSEERIVELKEILGDPRLAARARLAGLTLADSFVDARVQMADFLAGVARKIASEELNGRGDAELTELLRHYVDPASLWGHAPSWSRLRP